MQETLYDSMQQRRSLDPQQAENNFDDVIVPASQGLFWRSRNGKDQPQSTHIHRYRSTSAEQKEPTALDSREDSDPPDQERSSANNIKLSQSPSVAVSSRHTESAARVESRSFVGTLTKSLSLVGSVPGALRRLLFPGHAERPSSPAASGSVAFAPDDDAADLPRHLLLAVMLQQALQSSGSTQHPELLEQLRHTGHIPGCVPCCCPFVHCTLRLNVVSAAAPLFSQGQQRRRLDLPDLVQINTFNKRGYVYLREGNFL
jgi:hypothetical protein